MDRPSQDGTGHHGQITQRQLPDVLRQYTPHLHAQRITGILDVSEHGGDDHDEERDPEEGEEAPKVMVIAFRIKVRDAGDIIDGIEQASPRADLFSNG